MSVLYTNEEQKFSFSYPASWGKMEVKKGKTTKENLSSDFLFFSFSQSPNQFQIFFSERTGGKKLDAYNGKTYFLEVQSGNASEIFWEIKESIVFF